MNQDSTNNPTPPVIYWQSDIDRLNEEVTQWRSKYEELCADVVEECVAYDGCEDGKREFLKRVNIPTEFWGDLFDENIEVEVTYTAHLTVEVPGKAYINMKRSQYEEYKQGDRDFYLAHWLDDDDVIVNLEDGYDDYAEHEIRRVEFEGLGSD